MAPYVLVEAWRPEADATFDPELLGPGLTWLALSVRGIGYAGVTPFVEELFARSWLHRYVESMKKRTDFRDLAVGTPSRAGFLAVVIYWLISHVSWEAPVELTDVERLGDRIGDIEHDAHLVVAGHQPLVEIEVLHGDGSLIGEGAEDGFVINVENASVFVDHLNRADDLALQVAHRATKNRPGAIACFLVDGLVES